MRTRDFALITAHVAMLAFLFGCLMQWPSGTVFQSPGPLVRIRLDNRTASSFQHISLYGRDYGALQSGATSRYRSFAGAFRYGDVEAVAPDKTMGCQPIDYVGEELLPTGSYTYVLTEFPGDATDIHIDCHPD